MDTSAEISLYDKEAEETNPNLFFSSKHLGKGSLTGVCETVEKDFYVSKIHLNVAKEDEESVPLRFIAMEHDLASTLKPIVKTENLPDNIPLLFGSDLLAKYRARIDMRKKVIHFSVQKKLK